MADFDQETAPAKINLALHIRARRSDGYHELETMFAFARDGDELSVEPAPDISLTVTGPFGDSLKADENNLALQAAHALAKCATGPKGARLRLEKRLPIASGIGGGSADAAATLRLLNRFWRLELPTDRLLAIGATLGADVPACVVSETCIGSGRGDRLESLEARHLSGKPLLLVNPMRAVSTADSFARWDGIDRGAMPRASDQDAMTNGRNDFEPIAIAMLPEISVLLETLRMHAKKDMVRMSGSGATCFAVFNTESDRDYARDQVTEKLPGYWTLASFVR